MKYLLCVCLLTAAAAAGAQESATAPAPIVFFDIAGENLEELQEFYAEVFGWRSNDGTNFQTTSVSPLPAGFRRDPAETVIYIGVEDITLTLEQITASGGSVAFPRVEIPNTVVLGMFIDPAGNRVGLIEMEDGEPRIP